MIEQSFNDNKEDIKNFSKDFERLFDEIKKGIIGQEDIIKDVLSAIIIGGNVLLEGMPGLGKTQLIKTIAKALSLDFSRIQFTPDLMPSDITGTDILIKSKEGENTFKFQQGPVFANIVLADEINRATPKTQSSLLEAMQEKTVTSGGNTYPLPNPFFVLATQNPLELEGTYPLPEAQLDRFLIKLNIKFPKAEELMNIVSLTSNNSAEINSIFDSQKLIALNKIAKSVPISDDVFKYAMRVIVSTHSEMENAPEIAKKYIKFGSSPRGAQSIIAVAKVYALLDNRFNVSFEDIKKAAYPTLRHRIFLNFDAIAEDVTEDYIIGKLLEVAYNEA